MFGTILSIADKVISAFLSFFKWRSIASAGKDKTAISEAVRSGDEDDVARIHNNLLKLALIAIIPITMTIGCSTKPDVVYVNEPMRPYRMVRDGVNGWWISDTLYETTLTRLYELKRFHDENAE